MPADEYDDEDDRHRRRRRRRRDDDDDYYDDGPQDNAGLQYVIPINTNPVAIAAGYVGLFAVLCFPAPLALVLGIVALVQLKKKPEQHGKGRAIFAIVMGVLFSLPLPVLVVAGLFR
jgi:hypothetical protein